MPIALAIWAVVRVGRSPDPQALGAEVRQPLDRVEAAILLAGVNENALRATAELEVAMRHLRASEKPWLPRQLIERSIGATTTDSFEPELVERYRALLQSAPRGRSSEQAEVELAVIDLHWRFRNSISPGNTF